jgi:phospholipid/cholesterol/gamma-HCH transport system substrate-binding protein
MENQSHALIAGFFVILLGLGAIAGAIWLGPAKEPPSSHIDLLSTHSVAGLKVNATVRFRGVDVGHVESITFDPLRLGQIRVRVAVHPAAPITRSTFAELSYQGLTGEAFIQLDDERGSSSEPSRLSRATVTQMELRAGLLERAEDDVGDVVAKLGRVATRLEDALSTENEEKFMALVDSFRQTSERFGTIARDIEPSAKALPILLQQTTLTVERVHGAVDNLATLAQDTDRKLTVLDSISAAADQIGQLSADLHHDTLPRVNALMDEVSVDARELKRTLHQTNARPQSFIFGLPPTAPGPGERGFAEAQGALK